jgi:peptidoglycan/LPS O-acetylase OafA/YrhL
VASTTVADPHSNSERVPASSTTRGRSGAQFEAHIQGLRAVAVALVVLNHLVGWPSGGFIGVDVFFVISGFLITRLMLREVATTGRVSIREFYARRMRRIFPMAMIVLGVTVVAAFALLSASRAQSTLVDAFWASIFLENWHLTQVGTDYFHLNDAVSPVQQYWSLSVEEQFYLVWPAVLVGLVLLRRHLRRPLQRRLGERRGLSMRVAVLAVLTVVTIASFGWAVAQSADEPTVAYFSTATRAWELAAGALLAAAALRLPDGRARLRGVVVSAALVTILLAAVAISAETPSPDPGRWCRSPRRSRCWPWAGAPQGRARRCWPAPRSST